MEQKKALFSSVLKGAIISVVASLIGILIFAIIVKLSGSMGTVIKTVNQFIKIISVFLGCVFSLEEKNGLIKGVLVGILYCVMLYIIFFLMGSNMFSSILIDLLFMGVVGGILGIVAVNVKSK